MTEKTAIAALREFLECEVIPNEILRNFANKVVGQLEVELQRGDDWKQVVDLRDSEIANLNDKLATPVSLPKAAYFNSSAENLPFFRAFQVIEAIHKVGFLTVTYED